MFGNSLENLFYLLNNEHPPGYCSHSLSVSDVVEVCDGSLKGFWFCDRIGFKKKNWIIRSAVHPSRPSISERITQ